VKVGDIALHLVDALERGERALAAQPAPLREPVAGE
jgi:hypothetical protein